MDPGGKAGKSAETDLGSQR